MKIISFNKDPPVIYKTLNYQDLLESSGNDPPRSPPEGERTYEPIDWAQEVSQPPWMEQERPIYDNLPYGDDITFSG